MKKTEKQYQDEIKVLEEKLGAKEVSIKDILFINKTLNDVQNLFVDEIIKNKGKILTLECDLETKRDYQKKIQSELNNLRLCVTMLQELNEDLDDENTGLYHKMNIFKVLVYFFGGIVGLTIGSGIAYLIFR